MKLCRFQETDSKPYWGVVDEGSIRSILPYGPSNLSSANPINVPLSSVTLLPPVEPSNIICVGRNYGDHIEEMGFDFPDSPRFFLKPTSTLIGHGANVALPPPHISSLVEHEAELAVVISKPARNIPPDAAYEHLLGYTCADDISARDLQRGGDPISRAKGFDTFCPIGPWLQTEWSTLSTARLTCSVNGQLRQSARITDMIFSIDLIISYLSEFMTLQPGDIVLTGSPGGSAQLVHGDRVDISLDGVGTLTHGVSATTC